MIRVYAFYTAGVAAFVLAVMAGGAALRTLQGWFHSLVTLH